MPRTHIEDVEGDPVKPGAFISNVRRRATRLSAQRRAHLDELGMKWWPDSASRGDP
ncbi:hypothetical protein [Streptomyces sp. NPDC059224]|uniref:hypothetical protein n=1 Tax=Streptomyces sp. NPDC059224 TaxID=3346775 RepID=UPI003689A382